MSTFSSKEIATLREGGRRLADILAALSDMVVPGVSTLDLENEARRLIAEGGDAAPFLGYLPEGASRPFPAALCVCVNDEVVHGIPNEHPRICAAGDIVTLDMGLTHGGLITDAAVTVSVGESDATGEALIVATRDALAAGIAQARAGNTVGDIGAAVEKIVESFGFYVIKELGGHAVGRHVHEEPYIPNYGVAGVGAVLKKGMVLAIEPIVGEGTDEIFLADDGYTYKTADGSRAAQIEHTILITEDVPEILTLL